MRERGTELVITCVAGGLLMWALSRSYVTTLCFVSALGAVKIVYHELRRINRTLEAIAARLTQSSLIGL